MIRALLASAVSLLALLAPEAALAATPEGLNGTLSYSVDAAVSYANSHCATNAEWLCAEFTARSLHAGGEFPGVSDYGNYNGYNLRMVSGLRKALLSAGWKESGSGTHCGSRGNVLIYNINGDPYAHAAFALGNCQLDQHNPSRCGTGSNWGTNIVMSK